MRQAEGIQESQECSMFGNQEAVSDSEHPPLNIHHSKFNILPIASSLTPHLLFSGFRLGGLRSRLRCFKLLHPCF